MNYHFDYIAGICGVVSIALLARKSLWGFVFNILSQAFWIMCGLTSHLYGMALFGFVFTFLSIYGIINWRRINGGKLK